MLQWPDIETVFLDMDGTLLDLYFDNYFWREHIVENYAREHSLSVGIARTTLEDMFEKQYGSLNWYCIDYWSKELNLDIPELKKEIAHMISIRPTVLGFLEDLQKSHCRTVLVTNAHRKSLEIKLDHIPISHYFDGIFSSHDFNCAKEGEGFWDLLGKVEPFNREKAVLFDDSIDVLTAARDYGIAHTVCISQPDSQQPGRDISGFPSINLFDELPKANSGNHHD